jgi:hypothetical protein
MAMKSKLTIVAIAAVCIASPALAQSFDSEAGSGNIMSDNSCQTTALTGQVAARGSGLHAHAMVSRQAATGASTDPVVNGEWGLQLRQQKKYREILS